jgi:rRNA-processing protein FCF1
VLFDTNFLLLPVRVGIDVKSELNRLLGAYQIVIPSVVIQELEEIKDKNSKTSREVAFAKRLPPHEIIKTQLKKEETVDNLIIRTAKKNNYIVATADLGLKQRLREQNIPVIYLRQKRVLVLEGTPREIY